MAMRDDFAVLILTHGRADRVHTIKTLAKGNYTGKVFFVIDNEDETAEEYFDRFGRENVIIFDKEAAYQRTDTADTFGEKRVIVFARNESFRIAKELGLKYFLMLDDDYTAFDHRWVEGDSLKAKSSRNLDRLFGAMVDFLEESDADTVAFCQAGDFIGGANNRNFHKKILRKAMNSFFCRTDRPLKFVGTLNEDVCYYTDNNRKGRLIMSVTHVALVQEQTQSGKGGMSEAYLDSGTYLKTFYSVMVCPSGVKVATMGPKHKRVHHHVDWGKVAPKILNEKWRKIETGRDEMESDEREEGAEYIGEQIIV